MKSNEMKSNMIKGKMVKLASQLSAPELMEQARKINEMFDDWVDDVLMALLSDLEAKIPEADYIKFCDSL